MSPCIRSRTWPHFVHRWCRSCKCQHTAIVEHGCCQCEWYSYRISPNLCRWRGGSDVEKDSSSVNKTLQHRFRSLGEQQPRVVSCCRHWQQRYAAERLHCRPIAASQAHCVLVRHGLLGFHHEPRLRKCDGMRLCRCVIVTARTLPPVPVQLRGGAPTQLQRCPPHPDCAATLLQRAQQRASAEQLAAAAAARACRCGIRPCF